MLPRCKMTVSLINHLTGAKLHKTIEPTKLTLVFCGTLVWFFAVFNFCFLRTLIIYLYVIILIAGTEVRWSQATPVDDDLLEHLTWVEGTEGEGVGSL